MKVITFDKIEELGKENRYLIIENICNNLGLELDNIIDFTLNGLKNDKKIVNKINYIGNSQKTYYYKRTDINGDLYELEFTESDFKKNPVYITKDKLLYRTNTKLNKNLISKCVINNNIDENERPIYIDENKILNVASFISDKNAIGYFMKAVGNYIIQNESMTRYNLTINTLLSIMTDYYFYNIDISNLNEKIPLLYNTTADIFYMSLYKTITIFRYLLSVYEKTYIPLISIFIINDYYKIKKEIDENKVNILGVGFENKFNITLEMINKIFKEIENGICFSKIPNYEYEEI